MIKAKMINNEDHDLLIELRTEMQGIRNDIKDLKEGTTQRIIALENDKANQKDLDLLQKKVSEDQENRIRALESSKSFYLTSMVIYTAVGVTMIGLIVWHILHG